MSKDMMLGSEYDSTTVVVFDASKQELMYVTSVETIMVLPLRV